MSFIKILLRDAFEAARKRLAPTLEERAQQRIASEIQRLETDLILTVRGHKTYAPVDIKHFDTRDLPSERALGYFFMMEDFLPRRSDNQKPQSIEELSNRLQALGVSTLRINGLISATKADMDYRDPSPPMW